MQDELVPGGEFADVGRGGAVHFERAVARRDRLVPGLVQYVEELLPLRGAQPYVRPRVLRDELRHAGVGHQPPLADDDQVVGGEGHLTHQVRGDEDRAALPGKGLHEVADPVDALGVQTVHRLVEHQDLGVAEQRPGDAEPLSHAEGEALGALLRHRREADGLQHLADPGRRNAVALRETEQMVVGGAPTVHGLGVEQCADVPQRVLEVPVVLAVDPDVSARGVVQAEDHPHRGGLPGAVGPQEAGDDARPHTEGQLVDRRLLAVAFGQPREFDHCVPPRRFWWFARPSPCPRPGHADPEGSTQPR